jgi:hypothetical protein
LSLLEIVKKFMNFVLKTNFSVGGSLKRQSPPLLQMAAANSERISGKTGRRSSVKIQRGFFLRRRSALMRNVSYGMLPISGWFFMLCHVFQTSATAFC